MTGKGLSGIAVAATFFNWRPEPDAPLGERVMVRVDFPFTKIARPELTFCNERVWMDDNGDQVLGVTGWLPLSEAPEIEP